MHMNMANTMRTLRTSTLWTCWVIAGMAIAATASADWLAASLASPIRDFDGTADETAREEDTDRRGKVTVRRINPQCYSDWNNDPTALPYFFYQLERRTQGEFPIYVDNDGLKLVGNEMFDYPIIYFTSHYPFTVTDEEVENLQRFLARGGTLWLDDCTGSGPFMDSVPANVQRIAPGAETHLMTLSDPRFRDIFSMVYKFTEMPGLREDFCKSFQATLVNGRPGIIFCPNDYGCQWEVSSPPTSMNPLGNPAHNPPDTRSQTGREEVYQYSINWLFYSLIH